jgi:phosphatidylserine decarboxylase
LPRKAVTRVHVGQTAVAGETIIAEFDASITPPLVRVS